MVAGEIGRRAFDNVGAVFAKALDHQMSRPAGVE